MIENLVIGVDGMKDSRCESKVKTALGSIEGIQKAEVDVPGKIVAVSYDPSLAKESNIISAIKNQGYQII